MSRAYALVMALPPRATAKHRNTRLACRCMGYHFPHRRRGGACEHNTAADYWHALRSGLPKDEAMQLLSAADLDRMFPLTHLESQ
jgi:hypothetical protein